ncbi:MAG: cytochrome b/b6 domain-containing protein [Candidatus Heimdallarchaeota archaeon]
MTQSIVEYRVLRFGPGGRLHHWIHAAAMTLFIFSGLQLYLVEELLFNRETTRDLHIGLGIFILVWDLVYFFGFILVYDRHIKDMIPTPKDVKDLIMIIACAIGLRPDDAYPHYNLYDAKRGVYYRKYHPGQKFLYLAHLVAIFFMGFTGIGLLAEKEAGFLEFMTIFNEMIYPFMGILGFEGIEALRVAHFLGFVYFACTTAIHAYMAVLPQNYNSLRGMLLGTESIKEEIDS